MAKILPFSALGDPDANLTEEQKAAARLKFDAEHPFAPTGWAPPSVKTTENGVTIAKPLPGGGGFDLMPGIEAARARDSQAPAAGSHGETNARVNAGIYDEGTLGAANAVANGTGVVAPRPALAAIGDFAVKPARRSGMPAAPAAKATLTQGQPAVPAPGINLPPGPVFDLVGDGASTTTAAPGSAPAAPTTTRSSDVLALTSLLGNYAPAAPAARRGQQNPLDALGDTGGVLTAAAGLDALRTVGEAQRTTGLLRKAGALPGANDSPEARSNKLGYLEQRIRTAATGGTARAPGTPVYPGNEKASPGGPAVSEMATLAQGILKQSNGPRLVNLGNDASGNPVEGVFDGNNFSPLRKAEGPATQTVKVGDRTLTVGPGNKYFDEAGKPVEFRGDKPLDPITGQMLLTNYQNTIAQIEGHKSGWFEGDEKANARLKALQERANYQAEQIGFDAPFPVEPKEEKKPEKPAATPYRHEDVQAELKRRGLVKA